MQKKLLAYTALPLLMFTNVQALANTVTVGNFPEFEKEYLNPLTTTIVLNSSIGAAKSLDDFASASLTLDGRGNSIMSSDLSGIIIKKNTSLNILDVGKGENDGFKGFLGNNGVLNNQGNLTIKNSAFSNNNSIAGAGVFNDTDGTAVIENSRFAHNTVQNAGGAIYNSGTINYISGQFINNSAGQTGGAIANLDSSALINIVSQNKNTVFRGNTAQGRSNAVYNDKGTLNLNASEAAAIIFDDAIDGSSGIINVNKENIDIGGFNAPTKGAVEFNHRVSDNTVTLYNGTIKFGETTVTPDFAGQFGSFDSTVSFVVGMKNVRRFEYVDTVNGKIQTTNFGNLTLNDNLRLALDVSFKEGKTDTFTADSVTNGTTRLIYLSKLNIMNDGGGADKFSSKVVDDSMKDVFTIDNYTVIDNAPWMKKNYLLSYSRDTGMLDFDATMTLAQTVQYDSEQRIYNMIVDENVAENLGTTGGSDPIFVINANNNIINGNGHSGILLNGGAIFLNNARNVNGFRNADDGGFINNNGYLDVKNSVFYNNASENNGGAINSGGTIADLNADFIENTAKVDGGALYKFDSNEINKINGNFSKNTAQTGSGGAIFNASDIKGGIVGNFVNNTAGAGGGAIYNSNGAAIKEKIISDFIGNTVTDASNTYGGGAIYNYGSLGKIEGDFIGNEALKAYGGAIVNRSGAYIDSIIGDLVANKSDKGGAIYNKGEMRIYGGNITNNIATTLGGAVYNDAYGTLSLVANDYDITISGNTANGVSSAIYNDRGKINLNAGTHNKIVINDIISGTSGSSMINVNDSYNPGNHNLVPYEAPTDGTVYLNNLVEGSDIYLYDGRLKLGSAQVDGVESRGNFGQNVVFTLKSGTLDVADNEIRETDVGKFHADGGKYAFDMKFDPAVSGLDAVEVDKIVVDSSGTAKGTLNFDYINVIGNPDDVLADGTSYKKVLVSSRDFSGGFLINDYAIYTNTSKIEISDDTPNDGAVIIKKTGSGLTNALHDAIVATGGRQFVATTDAAVSSLGMTGAGQFTIQGNGHDFTANGSFDSINVADSTTLNIFDVGEGENGGFNNFNTTNSIIRNSGNLTIKNSTFSNNNSANDGAAIVNNVGATARIENVNFINNIADNFGGAIDNTGTISFLQADFKDNTAKDAGGGAIYSTGTITYLQGNFENNQATGENSGGSGRGGAIYNNIGTIYYLSGNFINNSAKEGGAIANLGGIDKALINIAAMDSDTTFRGNTANGVSNAILNRGNAVIDLNAGNGHKIVFEDGIVNSAGAQININNNHHNDVAIPEFLPTNGVVEFNNKVDGDGVITLYDGTVKFGKTTVNSRMRSAGNQFGTFTNNVTFNVYGGGVDLINGHIQNANLGNVVLHNNLDLKLDANLAQGIMDTISTGIFAENGNKINISKINILEPATVSKISLSPFKEGPDALKGAVVYTGGDIVYSPIYTYGAAYDPERGMIDFTAKGVNSAVLVAPVAAQAGGYLTQLNIYEQAFGNMDMRGTSPKAAAQNRAGRDKPAGKLSAQNVWIRPYGTSEKVSLKHGSRVSNDSYGTLVGLSSDMMDIKNGWDMMTSVYVGYNGSYQKYQGNRIHQNGGTFGLTGVAYKGGFFSGLTTNVGAQSVRASTMYGHEHFTMFLAGIASKSGYNWKTANGQLIIQPNYQMSYSYINAKGFHNAAGLNIKDKALHAVQIEPGIKLTGNLEDGWQPYGGAGMVWNLNDNSHFTADEIALPELSVKHFAHYDIGVQKTWQHQLTGYVQTQLMSGGRKGVGIRFGIDWAV